MKRMIRLLFISMFVFILVGCDYDEKSFQALSRFEIPDEVTMDFELPIGVYGKFIWTSSNNEVLEIYDQHLVRVNQMDEDIDVSITARINAREESFVIRVLKIGSEKTLVEKGKIVFEQFEFPDVVVKPIQLVTEIDGFIIEYDDRQYFRNRHYDIIEKTDGTTWLVPVLRWKEPNTPMTPVNANLWVRVVYQDEANYKHTISGGVRAFSVRFSEEDPLIHQQVFKSLEIDLKDNTHRYHVTEDFKLPLTSPLLDKAIISWSVLHGQSVLIEEDGKTVLVSRPSMYDDTVIFLVSITIEEITYEIEYSVRVLALKD